jgi:hypothetical protein
MLFANDGSTWTNEAISTEASALMMEAAMMDIMSSEEIEEFVSNPSDTAKAVTESVLLERSIVRLDKKAKLENLYKTAIFTIAKEKNDRDFAKLVKVWKSERFLEAKLEKKYGRQAMQRAKEAMRNKKKSGSSPVAAVAKKAEAAISKK